MKPKDIVPLVIVIVIASILALIISSMVIKDPPVTRKIDTMPPIQAEFETPEGVFSEDTIDTYVQVKIGEGSE